jgi:tetratricopeptide (TPR) repeat protein
MDDPSVEIAAQVLNGLAAQVRAGRAVLVVGAGLAESAGLPGWQAVLERLARAASAPVAVEVAGHIAAGQLARAARRLWGALGAERCEAVLAEAWAVPAALPDKAGLVGRLPVRGVWATAAVEVVAACLGKGSPAGWPEVRVVEPGDTRGRTLLAPLGAPGAGYALPAAAARRALGAHAALRDVLADAYHHGTLIFVGYGVHDPDLFVLLERLLSGLAPPAGAPHVLVATDVDAETRAALAEEHGIEVVAADMDAFLGALALQVADQSLARPRPAADDVEGWVARAAEDPDDPEARAALAGLLARARAAGRADRVVELLLAAVEHAAAGPARAAALAALAHAFETEAGDLPRAFTALCAAVRESPADEALLTQAERLAAETDGWGALVADLADIVPQVSEPAVAAGLWTRLGRWYVARLHHDDYALASFRAALRSDPGRADARDGLDALYRKLQRWGELAESLAARADLEPSAPTLLALAELHEHALASPGRAAEAFERVVALDPGHEDALSALERLYRRGEVWGKLAAVLERRGAALEGRDPARAAVVRQELALLRAEKLGDTEGAIARLEESLRARPRDADALRALAALTERLGRTEQHLDALERLAEVSPDGERAALLRRIAAEVEDTEGGTARAVRAYERLLELEPGAAHAFRGLERLHRRAHDWEAVAAVLERQLMAAPPSERAELHAGLARLFMEELADPRRAIDALVHAVDLAPDDEAHLAGLARLYERVEAWDRALATVERLARLASGRAAAELWQRAAVLLETRLGDAEGARERLAHAVEADPGYRPALLGLAALARARGDWAHALGLLLDAEQATSGRAERAALLFEAAVLADDQLGQPATALPLYARVLAADPEHVAAGRRAAEHWVAAGAHALAAPVLEMLVRKAEQQPGDAEELTHRHLQLGAAWLALGQLERAVASHRAALTVDPGSLPAALGLAEAQRARGEHAPAEQALREALARHRPRLAAAQVGELWDRIAQAARARGDGAAADDAWRRALEVEPGQRAALRGLADLAAERGDWPAVVRARRAALAGAAGGERARLHEDIGDVCAAHLGDAAGALAAYRAALELRPGARGLLHKLLDLHGEREEWAAALEVLDQLIGAEDDPAVRAKYRYTAGLIAHEELGAEDDALTRLSAALDDAPELPRAFEAIDAILSARQDWLGLARAVKAMLERLGGAEASGARALALWTRLGDLAAEKLGDRAAAIAAYEVAAVLAPDQPERREPLLGQLLAAGPSQAEKAAAELHLLLGRAPDRLDAYQSLYRVYHDGGQRDRAFCLAQALVFLGQATPAQAQEAAAGRPAVVERSRRRLTEELLARAVLHPREDRVLAALFGLLSGALAATTTQALGALGLAARDQTRPDDPHPAARLLRYASGVLGTSPTPALYLLARAEAGVQVANLVEKGALAPALVVSEPHLSRASEAETAFALAKKLAYLRPERYPLVALPSLARLEAALAAALVAAGVAPASKDPEVDKLGARLQKSVPAPTLAEVAALARKHGGLGGAAAIAAAAAGWAAAADLSANRVGLLVANDLETAARAVATERAVATTLSAKERLRDLLAYSVSLDYFAVRRHLGLEVSAT